MLKSILSIAVIIGSLAVLIFRFAGFAGLPPRIDGRVHVGLGEALAEEAAKAVESGGNVVLIAPHPGAFRHPGFEVQMKSFFKAARRANLPLSATNFIKLDPLRLLRVPAGDFTDLLCKQHKGDVIVSLLGPPLPTPEQRARIPATHARVVALCSGDMPKQINLKALFEEDLLHAAVVARHPPGLIAPQTDDPKVWFDHFYQVTTAANLERVLTTNSPSQP